ncbi:hypothetical protein MSH26_03325 [bacterium]|nr:hypothetical protein [bacterium]
MEKKNKIIILAITFALVLLCSGLTYAFFTSATPGESASTIVAKGGQMNVVYDNKSDNISVSNIYPREEAWVTKKFQVIGNNTTELLMFYKVKMVIDNNEFGLDLSYTLTGTNIANSGALIPNVLSNAYIGERDVSLGTGYHVKGTGNVHEYTLQIFLKPRNTGNDSSDNQNYAQQANFAAHLVIEIDGTSTEKAPKNWDSAVSNTLLAGIKKNYASPTATLTNPITDASASNEAVMSLTPDDYGISYYFRGNVQNNFVSFANMCWRIVRITGDGSIKLALYDYSSASCTNTGDTLAFARYNGDTYTTEFNENGDDNAYIGFMYGTPNSTTYAATHANINKSTILQNLETWYKAKLTSYTDKLADTIWCNDKSTVKDVTVNIFESENGVLNKDSMVYNGLGYQKEKTVYGSTIRNMGVEQRGEENSTYGTGPSLICPKDNDGGKLSEFTVDDTVNGNGNLDYKIGLLTVDEIVLAGMVGMNNNYDENSVTSYLRNNANYYYWTLSPYVFYFDLALVWRSGGVGRLNADYVGYSRALRPVVSLKSATTISGGTGTASSPFVIN